MIIIEKKKQFKENKITIIEIKKSFSDAQEQNINLYQ